MDSCHRGGGDRDRNVGRTTRRRTEPVWALLGDAAVPSIPEYGNPDITAPQSTATEYSPPRYSESPYTSTPVTPYGVQATQSAQQPAYPTTSAPEYRTAAVTPYGTVPANPPAHEQRYSPAPQTAQCAAAIPAAQLSGAQLSGTRNSPDLPVVGPAAVEHADAGRPTQRNVADARSGGRLQRHAVSFHVAQFVCGQRPRLHGRLPGLRLRRLRLRRRVRRFAMVRRHLWPVHDAHAARLSTLHGRRRPTDESLLSGRERYRERERLRLPRAPLAWRH